MWHSKIDRDKQIDGYDYETHEVFLLQAKQLIKRAKRECKETIKYWTVVKKYEEKILKRYKCV